MGKKENTKIYHSIRAQGERRAEWKTIEDWLQL